MSRLNIKNKESRFRTILYNHINNNKRGYIILIILFFIGLIAGVFFINNASATRIDEINEYLNQLINNAKESNNINLLVLFKQSLISNFILILILWFGASTIIGIQIVYGTIIVKGFSIGYTISSIITCFGVGKGFIISTSLMLLHNIIFIPSIFAISVSGIRLYQSTMKNKNRDNIKIEILRHTLFSILMSILILISSIVEIYCSINVFILILKYI